MSECKVKDLNYTSKFYIEIKTIFPQNAPQITPLEVIWFPFDTLRIPVFCRCHACAGLEELVKHRLIWKIQFVYYLLHCNA